MNRKMRFRLYHKKMGMSEPFPLFWDEIDFPAPLDDGAACIISRKDLVGNDSTARAILKESIKMQFQEVGDKKGKEICEGDLIDSLSYGSTMFNAWSEDDKEKGRSITLVKYIDCRPMLVNPKDGTWLAVLNHHTMSTPEKMEIIGNIYENPELLEA